MKTIKPMNMKPIKAMKCYISKQLSPLHLLFTEEDNVVVVRCLDFSISSHGETEPEALEAINSSLLDYIAYGLENGDIDNLFDPDVKEYWELYRELEMKQEKKKQLPSLNFRDLQTEFQEKLSLADALGELEDYRSGK
jgi:hypothetical protein